MTDYTFLFTDIEGSTRNWERYPAAMQTALERHDAILKACVEAQRGAIVKTTGDGLLAVFRDAAGGIQAAAAAQLALLAETWPLPAPLRVRMGLHSGPAQARLAPNGDPDYFGPTLNRTARLMAAGHGGQVLLSGATADEAADELAGMALRDLGPRRLKDLIEPEQIFQLLAPGLPEEFPPLNTLDRRPNNLPAQVTPLIGREREVGEIRDRLRRRDNRLVTLTGPGGTGKTRLAVQVAAELIDDFNDGVFFINLTPIRDPALVPATIARVLGVKEAPNQPIEASLHSHVRDRALLLVLDNFEQVIDAAVAVAALLAAAPKLKVLATSRGELNLRGEHEYPVQPLDLPPAEGPLPPVAELPRYAAVALFAERAEAVRPDFALAEANAAAVVEICRRLDGLPLAIELAAARLRQFTPEAMVPALSSRLTVLVGGARDLPRHQQTLRDAIRWSYDLLAAPEQRLFRHVAVCVGGCAVETLREIEAAAGNPTPDLDAALDALAQLSLLRRETGVEGEPRVAVLETIREFGAEELTESGERDPLELAHADRYLALAEAAESTLRHTVEPRWLDRLTLDLDNLRAGFDRSLDRHAVATVLRYGAALWSFWLVRDYYTEGRRRLAAAITLAESATSPPDSLAYGRVLFGAGTLARQSDDLQAALALHDRALTVLRASGDNLRLASALGGLGLVRQKLGDLESARRLYEELIERLQSSDTASPNASATIAAALNNLGNIARDQGRYDLAERRYEAALAIRREMGNRWGEGLLLYSLGHVALSRHDPSRAEHLFQASREVFQAVNDRLNLGGAIEGLGLAAMALGDLDRAETLLREALALQSEIDAKSDRARTICSLANVAFVRQDHDAAWQHYQSALAVAQEFNAHAVTAECLDGLAAVLTVEGQRGAARRLFTAAQALRHTLGVAKPPSQQGWYDRTVEAVRAPTVSETLVTDASPDASVEAVIAFALDLSIERGRRTAANSR